MQETAKSHSFEHYLSHILNIVDKLLTLWGMKLGFQELNPIINLFIFNAGTILGIILAGILGYYSLENLYRKNHFYLLRFVYLIYMFVCLSNLSKIITYYVVLYG